MSRAEYKIAILQLKWPIIGEALHIAATENGKKDSSFPLKKWHFNQILAVPSENKAKLYQRMQEF
jgi:hypothetical protein